MQNLKLFYIILEHSACVLLDDFDECKNEYSIRVQQLMYNVCYITVLHLYICVNLENVP